MTKTREEILAMPAGRELDALVAERVMGWILEGNRWLKPNGWPIDKIPNYSTDISAAWEVVDVYPVMKIEQVEIFKGNKSVKVTAWSGFDHHSEAEVTSKTAPEAICKAALLAVLEESP